jgi:hypothetical protein
MENQTIAPSGGHVEGPFPQYLQLSDFIFYKVLDKDHCIKVFNPSGTARNMSKKILGAEYAFHCNTVKSTAEAFDLALETVNARFKSIEG